MGKPRLTFKEGLQITVIVVIALMLLAAMRWRHDILQAMLDPKQPFQTYRPPPAPDYARRDGWYLLPPDPAHGTPSDPPADVFFIYPTAFEGGRDWNQPINDPAALRYFYRVVAPNYAGPFARVGRVFAPRYRQASLFTQLTLHEDARDAREFAYGDVRRAFDFFLGSYNGARPLVIAGVEQGGVMAQRLVREELDAHPDLKNRLAVAYFIDSVAPRQDYAAGGALPICERRGQFACAFGWTQSYENDFKDIQSTLRRSLVWGPDNHFVDLHGRPILCVNPLVGGESDEKIPARANLGAANATDLEWGTRPAFLSRQVSTQCINGVLRVSTPNSPSLKMTGGWIERLKEPGFNLFYADTEADAQGRVAALVAKAGTGAGGQ
ncbi:MAG: DUF3089 domain-containing protein [Caulobacteraceae bacterium]|nr:DUF3089 domain-containing protein [Caulobacteraceae bacterium]